LFNLLNQENRTGFHVVSVGSVYVFELFAGQLFGLREFKPNRPRLNQNTSVLDFLVKS